MGKFFRLRFFIAFHFLVAFANASCLVSLSEWVSDLDGELVPHRYKPIELRLFHASDPNTHRLVWLTKLLGPVLGVNKLNRPYRDAVRLVKQGWHPYAAIVEAFQLTLDYDLASLSNIPRTGPLIVALNHPRFGLDGASVASMLSQVRADVKVVMTSAFQRVEELQSVSLFVRFGRAPPAVRSRARVLLESIRWLRQGKAVVIFPAGVPSTTIHPGHKVPVDRPWQLGMASMIRHSSAPVVPIFVQGSPSRSYLQSYRRFPVLTSLLLLKEIVRQKGDKVGIRVGSPITNDSLRDLIAASGDRAGLDEVRRQLYELGSIIEPK